MATPTLVVLVVGALVTVLLVGLVVLVQVQRILRAYGEASRVVERVQPALARLGEQQEVTARELERVSGALDRLGDAREARRRR